MNYWGWSIQCKREWSRSTFKADSVVCVIFQVHFELDHGQTLYYVFIHNVLDKISDDTMASRRDCPYHENPGKLREHSSLVRYLRTLKNGSLYMSISKQLICIVFQAVSIVGKTHVWFRQPPKKMFITQINRLTYLSWYSFAEKVFHASHPESKLSADTGRWGGDVGSAL